MRIIENYFYFHFKKTKNLCNLINLENSSNWDILEDKIIELLNDDIHSLLNIVLKNKNLINKIINLYCLTDKINEQTILKFINSILLDINYDKDEFEKLLLSIFHDSFFTNNNAKFLLSKLIYTDDDFINSITLNQLLSDIENLSFYEIINKYKILRNSNIYIFINFYKNIIGSKKIFPEEYIENQFNNIVKPNLVYLRNSLVIIKNIIEFFSNSKLYKNYISKIVDAIVTKDNLDIFYNSIKNYNISNNCLSFINNYLNNKGLNILFLINTDRTKFWKEYFPFIEKVDTYNFNNKIGYAIYFKEIVVVEFDPIGAIFFYKIESFANVTKNNIYYEEQLKNKRYYITKVNHNYGWQYKVRNILDEYNIKLI